MKLTCDKLTKFDLVDDVEPSLFEKENNKRLINFFELFQEIRSVDQFIKDSPSFPGSTKKIIRGELVSAIGATLAIEGSTITNDEIEESFKKADLNESLRRKEQEAENSRKVYFFIMELAESFKGDFIYSEQMIKQIHKYFTDEMNYLSNVPGEYRGEFCITFGEPRKQSLCKTNSDVQEAMKSFVAWLNKEQVGFLNSNPIVKAITAHYYLSEIHPFGDGNGRTARALEALVLYVNGINKYCFWSLANFWSAHKSSYLVHLDNIRATCNILDFLEWGLQGYLEEIHGIKNKVLMKVKQLMFLDYVKYLLANKKHQEIKINNRIVDVIRLLIRTGKIELGRFQDAPEVSALYNNVSQTTRYRDFKKMIELGLINVIEEDKKIYIEPEYRILDLVRYNV